MKLHQRYECESAIATRCRRKCPSTPGLEGYDSKRAGTEWLLQCGLGVWLNENVEVGIDMSAEEYDGAMPALAQTFDDQWHTYDA